MQLKRVMKKQRHWEQQSMKQRERLLQVLATYHNVDIAVVKETWKELAAPCEQTAVKTPIAERPQGFMRGFLINCSLRISEAAARHTSNAAQHVRDGTSTFACLVSLSLILAAQLLSAVGELLALIALVVEVLQLLMYLLIFYFVVRFMRDTTDAYDRAMGRYTAWKERWMLRLRTTMSFNVQRQWFQEWKQQPSDGDDEKESVQIRWRRWAEERSFVREWASRWCAEDKQQDSTDPSGESVRSSSNTLQRCRSALRRAMKKED